MRFFFTLCIVAISFLNSPFSSADILPEAPPEYVLDEPHLLSPHALHALQTLLIEHDHLTGQQIMIGIFNNKSGEDFSSWSRQIYSTWKIGKRGQDNGALLAYSSAKKVTHLETGIGLDSVLNSEKATEIEQEVNSIGIKNDKLDDAMIVGAYLLLKDLESPLIETGKIDEILKNSGLHSPADRPTSKWDRYTSKAWLFFLLIGIAALSSVFYYQLSKEAHFSQAGWRKPSLFRLVQGDFKDLNGFKMHQGVIQRSPIVSAISEAESPKLYQVQVYLTQRWFEKDPSKRARRLYRQLNLSKDVSSGPILFFYINLKKGKLFLIGPAELQESLDRLQPQVQATLESNLRGTHFERAIALSILESRNVISKALQG